MRKFHSFSLNQFRWECITFPSPYNLHSSEILRAYSISLFIYRNVRRSIFLSFFIRIANNSARTERETTRRIFRARFFLAKFFRARCENIAFHSRKCDDYLADSFRKVRRHKIKTIYHRIWVCIPSIFRVFRSKSQLARA